METHLHLLPPQPEKPYDLLPPPFATGKRINRRFRDVSSRYMAAASPRSAPSSPIHNPTSTSSSFRNHRLHNPRIPSRPSSPDATDSESEHSSQYADENRRSFDTPVSLGIFSKATTTVKRHVVRLFSDNTGDVSHRQFVEQDKRGTQYRPGIGTPMPTVVVSRQTQLRTTMSKAGARERKTKGRALSPFPLSYGLGGGNSSDLDDSGIEICSISRPDGLCVSPPIRAQGSCRKQDLQLRSSMPEADSLQDNSRRRGEPKKLMFRNSLNSTFSSFQPTPLNLMKEVNNKTSADEMCDFGRTFLHPQLPSSKLGLDLKKGKKGSISKGDAHALQLLHNQYLQWKFVNAKEKAASEARVTIAERSLYDVSAKLTKLRDSVIEKRMELERLKRLKSLSIIIDLEMPHLEEWARVDEEYSASLSGTIKALKDVSIRLPVIGNVKLDVKELKVAMHSVTRIFETLSPSIGRYLPMVDSVEKMITELAKVSSKEKALVEECGVLLSQAQGLQVKECSLRGMLIQVKRSIIN